MATTNYSVQKDERFNHLTETDSNALPIFPVNPVVQEGGIFFESTTNSLKYSDGLVWTTVSTGPPGGGETLAQTLVLGNVTGGTNIVETTGDVIAGEDIAAGGTLALRGGNATATTGGPITLTAGTSAGLETDGASVTIRSGDGTVGPNINSAGGDIILRLGDFAQGGTAFDDAEKYGGYCRVICGIGKVGGDLGDRDSALHIQGRPGSIAGSHIVVSQDTPPTVALSGTINPASTDIAGKITAVANAGAGAICDVSYQRVYPRAAGGTDETFVVITPLNAAAVTAGLFLSVSDSVRFTVNSTVASAALDFSYHVYGAFI